MIWVEYAHNARNPRLRGPAARITSKTHGACGSTVIGAIAGHDLVTSGESTSDLDGILIGFSAAVRKKECVNVAGSDFRKLGAEASTRLCRHKRIRVAERLGLLG